MNHKKIEDSLRRAIDQTPTVDFKKLSAMPFVKLTDHDYITRQQEVRKPNTFRRFSMAVSFCLVMLVCFSGWFIQNQMPDSVITLDVNPSIEIVTNMQNEILTVKALNEDAQIVIGDRDYKNDDLNDAMDTLFTSMIREGYLTENKNTILISVENKDIKKAETLSLQMESKIRKIILSQNITPNLFREVFTKDMEASAAAGKYGISVGKTRLIQAMISSGTKLSFEELANMSIEDLFAITKEYTVDLEKLIEFDDDSDDDSDSEDEDEPAQPVNSDEENDDDSQVDKEKEQKKSTKESNDQKNELVKQQEIDQIENDTSEKTEQDEEEALSEDADSEEEAESSDASSSDDDSHQTSSDND